MDYLYCIKTYGQYKNGLTLHVGILHDFVVYRFLSANSFTISFSNIFDPDQTRRFAWPGDQLFANFSYQHTTLVGKNINED